MFWIEGCDYSYPYVVSFVSLWVSIVFPSHLLTNRRRFILIPLVYVWMCVRHRALRYRALRSRALRPIALRSRALRFRDLKSRPQSSRSSNQYNPHGTVTPHIAICACRFIPPPSLYVFRQSGSMICYEIPKLRFPIICFTSKCGLKWYVFRNDGGGE